MPTTMTETKIERHAYAAYGRVFRIEQTVRTGLWLAIGRGRGHKPMYLERLGCHADEAAMQGALNKWAAKYGFKPIGHRMEATA